MNKSELIDQISEKAEMSKATAGRVFDAIFDTSTGAIAEAVQAGKHVKIPGFGKFSTRRRAARKGRNPRTGAPIEIPEATVITFSPGKGLKETLASDGSAKKATAKPAGRKPGTKSGGSRSQR